MHGGACGELGASGTPPLREYTKFSVHGSYVLAGHIGPALQNSCDTVGADAHIGPDVRAIHSALRMIGRGGENGTGFPYAGICVVKLNKFHEKKLSGIENLLKAIDTVGKSC